MTQEKWLDAVTDLDPDILERYFTVKPTLTKKRQTANRRWATWGALAACLIIVSVLSLILIQALFKDGNTPIGPSNNSVISPLDQYHYDLVNIPYAILQIETVTDETVRLTQTTNPTLEDYTKMECRLLYANAASKSISAQADDFKSIYVISESAEALKSQDVILIKIKRMNMDGIYYLGPVTVAGQAEYISITDDHLVFSGNEVLTESFSSLFELNHRILDIKEYLARGGKTNEAIKALPKTEFRNGMTLEELIEYFSAWDKVKVESDKLPKPEYPH